MPRRNLVERSHTAPDEISLMALYEDLSYPLVPSKD